MSGMRHVKEVLPTKNVKEVPKFLITKYTETEKLLQPPNLILPLYEYFEKERSIMIQIYLDFCLICILLEQVQNYFF